MERDLQHALLLAEAKADAAELELERAHRVLDSEGVPREFVPEGEKNYVEYSLEARIRLLLE